MKYLAPAFFLGVGIFLSTPVSAEEGKVCTMQYAPVCGAQQVQCIKAPCYPVYHTYGNSCTLEAEKGTFIHEGECTAAETGPVKPAEEPTTYKPPQGCIAWNDGCNSCALSANGEVACTAMFCSNPGPGYCTTYAQKTTHGSATATPPTAGKPSPDVSSGATTSAEATIESGFFRRLWVRVTGWFHWF